VTDDHDYAELLAKYIELANEAEQAGDHDTADAYVPVIAALIVAEIRWRQSQAATN
jgi:hypothetical protein